MASFTIPLAMSAPFARISSTSIPARTTYKGMSGPVFSWDKRHVAKFMTQACACTSRRQEQRRSVTASSPCPAARRPQPGKETTYVSQLRRRSISCHIIRLFSEHGLASYMLYTSIFYTLFFVAQFAGCLSYGSGIYTLSSFVI